MTDAVGDANNAGDDDTRDTATLSFTISVAPSKPAGFTATSGDGEVTLGWTAIAGVSKWQVKQGTGNWADIASSGASTNSHKVTGLTNGTSYTFKVRAVVGTGSNAVNGVESDAKSATPKAALSATPGNGAAHLSWSAVAGVSGWEVKQGSGSWTAISGSDATTAGHTVTGLANGTAYDFKVRSFTGSGGSRVNGAESAIVTVTPADQLPSLTGTIADQALTQGTSFTSGTAFPAATGGDAPLEYSVASLPSGITLGADRKLTGTATAPLAKTSLTYTVTDAEGDASNANDDDTRDTATLTFNISVAPKKPAAFAATAGDAQVALSWTAISGVSEWEVKQGTGSWTAIASSGATTNSHTVTGLTNGTAYTFRVRAVVGASGPPDARVYGVASDAESATPGADLVPVLPAVTDKTYVQGATVDFTLPAATGGDSPGSYTYTLTPALPAGLTFTAGTRKLTGTPSAPAAKVTYTYKAEETTDTDNTLESDSETFTIGVQPKKPANFTATAGNTEVTLGWTALAGVTKWQVKQDSGSWTDITGSGAATTSHVVTSLTNGTEYTFKVRALVGSGGTLVTGVESDAKSATPGADLVPVLPAVTDKTYVQGATVDFTLPAATGGDSPGSYTYTLTPAVSGSGLAFTASTRKLSGTPNTPKAKITYTYTATETNDSDGTVESADRTFTIGIQPKKPANLSVTSDGAWATLTWTAIPGVSGWQVQQNNGRWTGISNSSAITSRAVVHVGGSASTTFKVRAFVGSGDSRVDGVESDAQRATQVIDYDHDDDGLIDISTLAQLQASRLDTNGDGRTDDRSMQPLYDRAFPGAADRMGCPFPGCRGYELTTDDLTPRPRG